jgi:hypothetical protein
LAAKHRQYGDYKKVFHGNSPTAWL